MRDSRKNLIVRMVYGLLFALSVMGAAMCGVYGFGVLLLAIIVGGSIELFRMAKIKGFKPQWFLAIVGCFALFAMNFDHLFFGGEYVVPIAALFVLIFPLAFVVELFTASSSPIGDMGSMVLPLIYVAIPTMLLGNVVMLLGGGEYNGVLVIAYFFIVWANDSFAYLVGITLGSHPMFPRISPKKSWEGFAGGVIGSIIFAVGLAQIFGHNCYVWGAMALLLSVTGVLGDLVESMFKRSVEIKDSGDIIPGHGGWLDRFDAIFISTPFVYVYLYILNIAGLI